MSDCLHRGVLGEGQIRFAHAVTTGLANEAVLAHDCDPVSAHVLCRALTAGVLTSPLLVDDERYTLRWQYAGALASVVVDVDGSAQVRGFVTPTDLGSRADTEPALYGESGRVATIKSSAASILSSSVIEAQLMDVVEDLAFLFCASDQIETGMAVLVGFAPDVARPVSVCQGVMLQALPDCDLERFERIRRQLAAPACRDLLSGAPGFDGHAKRLARALCGGETPSAEFSLMECEPPCFRCHCTRERMLDVVRALPEQERRTMLAEGEDVTIRCQFCAEAHTIAMAELADAMQGEGQA